MQAALHQQLAFSLVNEFDRLRGRGFAVVDVDDFELPDVEPVLARDRRVLAGRTNQDRLDKSGLRSVYAAAERSLVTRVNRYRRRRCDLFRGSNQAVVFRVGAARCGVDLSESHDDPSVPIKVKIRLRSLGAVLPES